jgi:hypothetical protein
VEAACHCVVQRPPICLWKSFRRSRTLFQDRPETLATELLQIAQDFSTGQRWSSAAITMARWGGDLETRLHAILAPQPKRRATKLSFAATSVLALLTCTASALSFRPEQQTDFPGGLPMKRTLLSGLLASAGSFRG